MASEDDGPQCNIQLDLRDLADLCTSMPRRLLTTGILVQWMRIHFTDPANIESEILHNYLWTDDITTTKILIDSVFRFNPAQTELRPGIYVKPGKWTPNRMIIDDRKMPTINWDGTDHYVTFYQGSHTLFCIAGESAEVELLSTEVYRELIEFGPIVRKEFNFMRFVVSEIGEPAILEEATENFVVPIVVSYGLQDMWKICKNGNELDELNRILKRSK